METLDSFPLISTSEFERACDIISSRFDLCGHLQNDSNRVQSVKQDMAYLRITRMLYGTIEQAHTEAVGAEDEVDEVDEEALQTQSTGVRELRVEYQIFLSPTYQVPVLYLILEDQSGAVPPTMESLYEQVIPEQFKSQVRDFGIIGGITMTDHPLTNRPVFFVHPCNTAEALEASLGEKNLTGFQYLLLWTGLVGGCVGLQVPTAIALGQTDSAHLKSDA